MCRKGHIGPERPRGVHKAERVPAAEAVARDGQLGEVEAGLHERDGRLDDGVRDVRAVGGQEGGGIEGRVVEVGRGGLTAEEVGGYGDETCSSEGIGQSLGGGGKVC